MANTSVRRVAEVFKQVPSGARGLVDAYLVGALASNVDETVFNQCAELALSRVKQMHPDKWGPEPSGIAGGMQTVITTNNAYDSILLVDDAGRVVSAWQADKAVINDYLRDGSAPDTWQVGEWPRGFDPDSPDNAAIAGELRTIEAYGQECGRNGVILDNHRREFWNMVRHT
jgi:hypothetical protein